MEKFLKSKLFLVLTPTINFILFFVSGILLSYVPHITISAYKSTEYIFSIKNAVGIWLIGIAVTLLVFLVCVLIQKIVSKNFENK